MLLVKAINLGTAGNLGDDRMHGLRKGMEGFAQKAVAPPVFLSLR